MTLQIVALGVGGAFSQKYYSTSIAVTAGAETILVDCPHPIRKMLKEAHFPRPVDIADIQAVLISHLHADHVSGLEGLLFYSRFHVGNRATVLAAQLVLDRLWPHHLAAGMDSLLIDGAEKSLVLEDYAKCLLLSETEPTVFGAFQVACRRTKHHVPTYAFKIFAGGTSLGYSADTEFDPSLIEWLSECDLIIHETNEGIHTPYEQLAGLDAALRQKMRLIHYPDDFDLKRSAIAPLMQGVPITIP